MERLLEVCVDSLESALAAAPEESQADKWLRDTFGGLSPLICRELAFRAGGATDARLHQMGEGGRARLLDELEGLLRSVQENSFTPVMLEKEGHPSTLPFSPSASTAPPSPASPSPPSPPFWTAFTSSGRTRSGCASGART